MKYTYQLECFAIGAWIKVVGGSRQYLQGYLDARMEQSPRLAYRLMRSDGTVIEQEPAREDVSIGQVAGFPTADQYERAAQKALSIAAAIHAKKHGN